MTQLDTFEKYILPEQQIRISTFDRVNDPFELLGLMKHGNKKSHQFAWLREYWTTAFGFISFSDNWRSPLMWAHYADNHKGVCLGIDVKFKELEKITYHSERTISNIKLTDFETAADRTIFQKLASSKFEQWSYEKEWRLFRQLDFDPKDTRPDFFYEQFSPDFELREVILGARCIRTKYEMQRTLFATTESISIKKARPAFNSFDIVENNQKNKVTVYPRSNFSKSEIKRITAERYANAYAQERASKRNKKQ